jgi:hypothetical protein
MSVIGALRFNILLHLTWINLFAASANLADAQVVLIPHGDFENDFEKYLVVTVWPMGRTA